MKNITVGNITIRYSGVLTDGTDISAIFHSVHGSLSSGLSGKVTSSDSCSVYWIPGEFHLKYLEET